MKVACFKYNQYVMNVIAIGHRKDLTEGKKWGEKKGGGINKN